MGLGWFLVEMHLPKVSYLTIDEELSPLSAPPDLDEKALKMDPVDLRHIIANKFNDWQYLALHKLEESMRKS